MRQFAGTPPALIFRGAITVELCSMVKVRPLGSKGSNPLQGHAGVCMYPCVFHVLRALATTEKRCVISRGAGARVLARGSVHGRATPSPLSSRAALRLW